MGRKLGARASPYGEPETLEISENQEKTNSTKKKEKKRSRSLESVNGDQVAEENLNLQSTENGHEEPKKRKKKKDKKQSDVDLDGSKEEKKKKKKKYDAIDETNNAEQEEEDGKKGGVEKGKLEGSNAVVVSGNNSEDPKYAALGSFAESRLPAEVLDCCKSFSKPSPIQAHAWPYLLDGRDFIGIAATGSGKTIAFGVPALMHILKKSNKKASKKAVPRCLVLSPTRELAQQIAEVLSEAGSACGIKSVCLYGGTSKGPQISSLKSGVDIVIGTPGRMKDLIEMGICNLNEVSFVVLDEADRMLDMGFEPEVRSILSQTCSGLLLSPTVITCI